MEIEADDYIMARNEKIAKIYLYFGFAAILGYIFVMLVMPNKAELITFSHTRNICQCLPPSEVDGLLTSRPSLASVAGLVAKIE